MKKIIFVIILFIAFSLGVYAEYSIHADDIKFTPANTNWNVDNVNAAINDIYDNLEIYDNKEYTTEGLAIYDDRAEIIDGGYYIDDNGTTWFNITLKIKKELTASGGQWTIVRFIPDCAGDYFITDVDHNYMFGYGSQNFGSNQIVYNGVGIKTLYAGEIVTLRFKY